MLWCFTIGGVVLLGAIALWVLVIVAADRPVSTTWRNESAYDKRGDRP